MGAPMEKPVGFMYASRGDCEIWVGEKYPTREAAEEAGRKEFGDESFATAALYPVKTPNPFVADNIFCDMGESLYEKVGSNADDYMSCIKAEAEQALEERLYAVLLAWMKEHDIEQEPYHRIDDIEEVAAEEPA